MEECMAIIHNVTKGPMMNTIEKFDIYKQTRNSNQLNDKRIVGHNAIFETLLRNRDE
jgi:hypothetical protein